jgi:hypothetical protein
VVKPRRQTLGQVASLGDRPLIVDLETRPLAEEWTFRYLGAALAEFESEQHPGPEMRAAELPIAYGAAEPPTSKSRRKTRR